MEPRPEALTLDRPESFAEVDFGDELLPLWVAGSLGDWSKARWVAVVLNGLVATVTETYELDGSERFAALVPPAALRARGNIVEVRALSAAGLQPSEPPENTR